MTRDFQRQHLNGWDKPKVQYKSYNEARIIADAHQENLGELFDVYMCPICYYFHTGHRTKLRKGLYVKFERREETLAGILVHTLRLVLDKK